MARIGFIGLGMMGLPMARSLLRHGHHVLGCDSNPAARDALAEGSSAVAFAATPAEVAAGAETMVLMLPDSQVVSAVMEGQGGLLGALKPGQLVLDMSSSLPAETRRLAPLVAATGAMYADAPVSGGVAKARAGTLAIMFGGSDAAWAQGQPVLAGMGEQLIRCGDAGAGHAAKALNNFLYGAGLLAAAEAFRMGEKLGLDLSVLTDVINASSGRNVATELKAQAMIQQTYPPSFQLGLMRKDLATAAAIAEETGEPAVALKATLEMFNEAVDALGPKVDCTEIHRYLGMMH